MISEIKGKVVPVKLWAPLEEVESQALDQLRNTASLPWVRFHVAAMADVHYGKGATVGSVVAMKDAVAPSAVGVDIGCGMGAVKTSLTVDRLHNDLTPLYEAIDAVIPSGFNSHAEAVFDKPKVVGEGVRRKSVALMEDFNSLFAHVSDVAGRAALQLGTLGGGNHFIELSVDTDGFVWLMLHSGSRNVGKMIADFHIFRARELEHNRGLVDRDLSVFLAGTPEMAEYRHDLIWAQQYAWQNRVIMMELYKDVLRDYWPGIKFEDAVHCHHNYVAEETHFGEDLFVTRKGAIRAGKGEMGIIPGSMGAKSYIVRGLGNPESFMSASHGAGRKMSRGQAKKRFTIEDFRRQTEGVVCRKDKGVIDEIPGAYKDIEKVMKNQEDLVEVVATLKQVLCLKGGEQKRIREERGKSLRDHRREARGRADNSSLE